MSFARRKSYYKRCQAIVDDLHGRIANKEFISETECEQCYGKSNYHALKHELHLMNANINNACMTPAMEWLYHSQHFANKAADEARQTRMFWVSVISACVAVASAVYACWSNL